MHAKRTARDNAEPTPDREATFQTLFEISPDAIFIEDISGNVLDCNPAAAALHHTTREEIIGRNAIELVRPERRAALVTLSGTMPAEFEGWSLAADGNAIPVSIRTTRIQYLGQPALLLHVREGRRQLEHEIPSAHKMEAVARLAAGVAQVFNNLLTAIMEGCETVLGRLGNHHPLHPDLLLIYDAAQKAASVTRQLRAFGGQQVLQTRILDLNAVIRDLEMTLRPRTPEKIEITLAPGEGLWTVEADRGQIEQALMNVVLNAFDAMPHGGKLQIRTGNMKIEDAAELGFDLKEGDYVVVTVQDSGHGMNSEILPHVFEPFFTTKETSKGMGLGLASAYGIVTQSGGYISASSHSGRDTTITICLPALRTGAEPADAQPREATRGTETILIVEDAAIIRQFTREILEVRGYTVIEAGDGVEAIEICKSYPGAIHLTLSDVMMPNMNGCDLAEQAARLRPDMKLLLMSGYAAEAGKSGFLQAGVHFIEKPFTSRSLALKIRDLLDDPGH